MSEIMYKDNFQIKGPPTKGSLNREYRNRQLQEITYQNQDILKRIQMKQPHYNHLKWEDDRRRNEQYCRNICEYEYILNTDGYGNYNRMQMLGDEYGEGQMEEEVVSETAEEELEETQEDTQEEDTQEDTQNEDTQEDEPEQEEETGDTQETEATEENADETAE